MDFTTGLNDKQKEAVLHTEGPLLILAGAGSGKTRVLTHRIAHLVENKGVKPWSILAITFTNKAAKEMKERLAQLLSEDMVRDMWVSTFHSMCVRILRRYAEQIGYSRYFTIYDTADQKTLIKDTIKLLNINEKNFPVGMVMGAISNYKNNLLTASEAMQEAGSDYRLKQISKIYSVYEQQLKENNAMDFDDLLLNTYLLFKKSSDALGYYQNKFQYILVDEYQDTNGAQYKLVEMLAKGHQNLCVVGDDDQSIYGWRGADISNILDFEQDFLDASVIKLEQNYRSTKNILEAANSVVAHNKGRKPKKLWTESESGERISVIPTVNEYKEAESIAQCIEDSIKNDAREYKNFAILYRTNAQSRVLEEKMISESIPYRLLGGVRFYERKEIKDIISYLKVISNPKDDIAIKRIINVPKRGIGDTSVQRLSDYAFENQMDFFEVARYCREMEILGTTSNQRVLGFVNLIEALQEVAKENDIKKLIEAVLEKTEYREYLRITETETAEDRLNNINELISKAIYYMENTDEPTLDAFLEDIALVADVDNYDEESNSVVLMTLHSAKGLEFPVVFMPGLEDGLFPSYMCITEGEDKVEEERRLCYVGITRAREKLYILYADQRTMFGSVQSHAPSRFIDEMPKELTNLINLDKSKRSFAKKVPEKAGLPQFSRYNKDKKVENIPSEIEIFNVGDQVKHIKFGQGVVEKVEKDTNDCFVTIDFNRVGIKKLSTKYAKLKRL